MAARGSMFKDIVIGLALIVLGGTILLNTMGLVAFDDATFLNWFPVFLLAIGLLLLVIYPLRSHRPWLMIVGLCLVFLAAAFWIPNNVPQYNELVGVTLFALTAIAFLFVYLRDRTQWWALMVCWTCLGLAFLVLVSMENLSLPSWLDFDWQRLQPIPFLACIGFGFFVLWLTAPRRRWWALLTSGLIGSVISAVAVVRLGPDTHYAPIAMFLTAGFVFFLVWLLRNDEYKLHWAIYPTAVLLPLSAFLILVLYWSDSTKPILGITFLVMGALFILAHVSVSFFTGRGDAPEAGYKVISSDSPEYGESIREEAERTWNRSRPAVTDESTQKIFVDHSRERREPEVLAPEKPAEEVARTALPRKPIFETKEAEEVAKAPGEITKEKPLEDEVEQPEGLFTEAEVKKVEKPKAPPEEKEEPAGPDDISKKEEPDATPAEVKEETGKEDKEDESPIEWAKRLRLTAEEETQPLVVDDAEKPEGDEEEK